MDTLSQLALRSQTVLGGVHFLFFLISWLFVIGLLKDYHDKDRLTFNCVPKPSDFNRQRCYDNYTSAMSPLLTPLDFAGITYGALGFIWVLFILTGAMILRRIQRERSIGRKRRQSIKFMRIFACHIFSQLAVLGVMMGLFCGYQSFRFPAVYKCSQTNTTLTTFNKAAVDISCNDLRYKEKTKLNIAIIVIMAISIALCLLTVIHLAVTREAFLEQLLGDIFQQEDDNAAGMNLVDDDLNVRSADANDLQTAAANAYSRDMKASIKRNTEFQPKLLDAPTISNMKTDEIFTNLLLQHGRKRIEVEEVAGRRERLGRYGQVSGTRVKHSQEIFIRAADDKNNPTFILLTGKAGIGKTMFCQKLIRDWADDKLFQASTNAQKPDFKFAYLLTFRQLNLLSDKYLSLQEVLNYSSMLDDQCNVDDSLLDYIVSHPEEVLIILDGYDEYSQQDNIPSDAHQRFPNTAQEKMPVAAICAKLIQGQILGKSTVMLTSRPDESDKLGGRIHFDREVEITGFSELEVKEYIERYFRENETMKNTVLEHITNNEDLVSFAHIPVLCALMCSYIEYILKKSNSTDDLPVSMSELYFELFYIFELKHNKKKAFPFVEARLNKLSEFAAQLLMEKRFLFNEEDMKKFNLQEDDQEGLIASGILHCGPPFRLSFSRTTKYFCFTHLTLQEYLAARCFVEKRKIPERSTVSTVVLQFMAGILSKVKDSKLMEELLNRCQRDEHLLKARCLIEYEDKEFAKNHYRQYPVDESLSFGAINDVDCIAISFLLDIINTLNEEETTANRKRLPSKQPFLRLRLAVNCANLTLSGVKRISRPLQSKLCVVTELELQYLNLDDTECVKCFSALVSLQSLYMLNGFITDAGITSLGESLKHPSCRLTTLHLRCRQITDAGVASLCKSLKHPNCQLTTLHLSGNQITDAGIVSLCGSLKHPSCQLTTLDLSRNEITDAGIASLYEAIKHPNCQLTTLHLSGNQITDAGIASLCKSLKHPSCQLTTIHLRCSLITDAGIASLCEAIKHPSCQLTTLDLSRNEITDAGIASLCEAIKHPNCQLTTLHPSGNQITDAGIASLCEVIKHPNCQLTTLHLRCSLITDAGVVSLCEAITHPNCQLTTLHLRCSLITDAGVASLCEAIKHTNCQLTTLHLSGSLITDAGIASLCEAINDPNCQLTTLHLSDNQITDAGVASLCDAIIEGVKNCKLAELDLRYNYRISNGMRESVLKLLKQEKPDFKIWL